MAPDVDTETDAETPGFAGRVLARLERLPVLANIAVVSALFFLTVALRTPIDVDEGFYALAAELVAHGKTPYADFFYPQAPLHPYLLAGIVGIASARFVVLRVASALLATAATTLVAHAVHRETRSAAGAFAAATLFAAHELSWQWLPTVRPYALGAICAIGALVVATPLGRAPRARELVAAGAIAALAPLGRLPLAPVVGVVALAVMFEDRSQAALLRRGLVVAMITATGASLVSFPVAGAAIATLAAATVMGTGPGGLLALRRAGLVTIGAAVVLAIGLLPFWLTSREQLAYGLVGYHADTSTLASWPKTRPFLSAILGGGSLGDLSALGSQDVLLVLASLVSLALPNAERRIAPLVGVLVLAIGGARHVPAIEHYATPLVSYLVLGAAVTVAHLFDGELSTRRAVRNVVVTAGIGLYLLATAGSFTSKWLAGRYGVWDMRAYRPGRMDAATRAVAEVAEAHPGPVLTMWPGSALGLATRIVPGYEDHFSRLSASKRSAERERLHLTTEDDLKATIRTRVASVVVLDRETPPDRKPYEDLLAEAGYTLDRRLGDVAIYVR